MRVLVVDDSATQRSLIKVFLSGHQLEFVEAANGVAALQIARTDRHIDLIVTDLNMPQMDGVELVRKLRQSDDARLHAVPIIVLTAERAKEWFEQARAAGATAFCNKPVSQSDLLVLVTRELGLPSIPPPTPRRPSSR
jgi:two-component system chemotaxis response regulator CheY